MTDREPGGTPQEATAMSRRIEVDEDALVEAVQRTLSRYYDDGRGHLFVLAPDGVFLGEAVLEELKEDPRTRVATPQEATGDDE